MFTNIGKTIRVLAIVLAILSFLGFAALGALTLIAALDDTLSEELQTAGLQTAIACFALCILTPFLDLILYGFGTLISAVQAQAEDSKKTREMLQSALSGGMLSDEIARKSAQAQAKLLEYLAAHTPAPAAAAPKKNSRAPMQRPVKEMPPVKEAPAQSAPAPVAMPAEAQNTAEEMPAQQAPAFIPVAPMPPAAPAPMAAPMTPVAPTTTPYQPIIPAEGNGIWAPLSGNDETF